MSLNKIITACAGSGKTTRIVRESIKETDHRRILVLTYTNNNLRGILNKYGEEYSGVPKHVDASTWFPFLFKECARPYQNSKYARKRIDSIHYLNHKSTTRYSASDVRRYFFSSDDTIFSDKLSHFVVECENETKGKVADRLRKIYSDIFIDEFQDLAGWDLDLIEILLKSGIRITLVGDPRQHIYSTNPSGKNKQFRGIKFLNLAKKWEQRGWCSLESMINNYRCNQSICDFANFIWGELGEMESKSRVADAHSGVFLVSENDVDSYVKTYKPQILRDSRRAKTFGTDMMNFGLSKGLQFDRVLVIPTDPIKKFLRSGNLKHIEKAREKLYVAVTRAKHSVAFIFDGESPLVPNRFAPT